MRRILALFWAWWMACGIIFFSAAAVKADWTTSWDTDEDWRGGTYENVCVKDGKISIGVYPSDPFFDSGGWYGWTEVKVEVDEVYAEVRNNQAYFYAKDRSGLGGEYGEAYGYLSNTFYFDASGIKSDIKLSFWWKAYTTDFNQGGSRTSLSIYLRKPSGAEVMLWSRSYYQPQSGTIHDGVETVEIRKSDLSESGFYTLRITAYWYLNPTGSYNDELFYWYLDDIRFGLTSAIHVTPWEDMGTSVAWKTLRSTASISPGQSITAKVLVSDDGFSLKGSYEIPLVSGTSTQNLYLPVARYVRIITSFTTSQAGTSPSVGSYVLTVDPVPSLSSGRVIPEKGGINTTFTFTVVYRDPDGDPPASGYPKVYIDGTGYEMTKISGDYATGATYQFLTATLSHGTHSYWFEASDGTTLVRFPDVGRLSGPTVNTPPTLSSGGVSPSSGSIYLFFTFTITYTDPDNDPPVYVKVYIDDVPYDMTRTGGSYVSGAIYSYTTTLERGIHQYFFLASDGIEKVRFPDVGTLSGPTVSTPPTLSSGGVSPSSGSASTPFTFTVTYTDPDGDPPLYVKVCIDNVLYEMISMGGNYTIGVTYSYTTTLERGIHQYFFLASDGIENVRFPDVGTLSGPTVVTGGAPEEGPTAIPGERPTAITVGIAIAVLTIAGTLGVVLLRRKLGKPRKLGRPKRSSSAISRASRFCSHCRLKLPEEADFCPQCGRKTIGKKVKR